MCTIFLSILAGIKPEQLTEFIDSFPNDADRYVSPF
jgi:hypothetical protein